MRTYMTDGLQAYLDMNYKPWHMPGHKRKSIYSEKTNQRDVKAIISEALSIDVTELPLLDDLHCPENMLAKTYEELKKVYGCYSSHLLVNGSTCGISAAVSACCVGQKSESGADIIVAENCHKSVSNIIELLELKADYVPIKKEKFGDFYGRVLPEDIEVSCRNNKSAKAIIVTSPTYEGIISDIASISRVAKKYGMKLIVDEAHGAHLPFFDKLQSDADDDKQSAIQSDADIVKQSAINNGADIVIQSLHKTMGSFTQTAILHNNCEKLEEKIKKYLQVFMSTSPSYIMVCCMELAIADMCERDLKTYLYRLKDFRKKVEKLECIDIYSCEPTRIVLKAKTKSGEILNGEAFKELLADKWNIDIEMSGKDYIVLISTVYDEQEDIDYLYNALYEIDNENRQQKSDINDIYEKDFSQQITKISEMKGRICEKDIYVYPPGIPIVRRGEAVTDKQISYLKELIEAGKSIRGL